MEPDEQRALSELRLLQLADSALPIGALTQSFGLETLVASEMLSVSELAGFLRGYIEESGFAEVVFCREAHRVVNTLAATFSSNRWVGLNQTLSARKTARESCAGSAALGRNFLEALIALDNSPVLRNALVAVKNPPTLVHHCTAFGLAAAVIGIDEDRAALTYLHQSTANLISACQRLLPLGQTGATRLLWDLKPQICDAMSRSKHCSIDDACSFMPLLDWAAMEHPALFTRLFIS